MLKNLLLVGLLTGVISGSLLTLLQSFTVIPLIQQAEQYEEWVPASSEMESHHDDSFAQEDWKPDEGWERLGFTWLANLSIASGFGLMMAGIMALHRPRSWAHSILFAACGYYAFFLAPALLLPPELPGSESPHLAHRQATWLFTVLASLAGLGIMGFVQKLSHRLLGLAALAAPFLIFTPLEVHYAAPVPPELITRFTWLAGVTNSAHWLILGFSTYWISLRLNSDRTPFNDEGRT